jgi:sulfur relay protein TusB/DsrH
MAKLHTLNRCGDHPAVRACLTALGAGDTLLLIEDGVYNLANPEHPFWSHSEVKLLALAEDLIARATTPAQSVNTVDYPGFVALTASHSPIVNWY